MAAPTLTVGTANQGTTGAVTYTQLSHTAGTTGLFLATETNTTGGLTDPTAPTPNADIAGSPRNQGSNITTITAWWKRPLSGTETDWSVPAAADHQVGIPFKIEGGLTSGDPWDVAVADGQAAGTTGRTFDISGGDTLTTLVADSLVVYLLVNSADIGTDNYAGAITTPPTGLTSWTIHDQHQTTNGNGGGLLIASGVRTTAGVVGPLNWDFSTSATYSGLAFSFPPALPVALPIIVQPPRRP